MTSNKKKSEPGPNYHVPNLKRALQVLELLGANRNGMTLSEIVDSLSVPKNSIFRITATLTDTGYLSRDENSKKFFLTRKMLAIGCSAVSEYSIVEKSFDIMCQLRNLIHETVLIGTIAESKLIVMEQAVGTYPFKFTVDIGSSVPLNTAAPAKCIMAHLPQNQLADLLKTMTFEKFNERTITSPKSFCSEFKDVRTKGYAIDNAEQLDGVHCIGAPIFDRYNYPVASIWTTGPSDRLPKKSFDKIGTEIKKHAGMISQRL